MFAEHLQYARSCEPWRISGYDIRQGANPYTQSMRYFTKKDSVFLDRFQYFRLQYELWHIPFISLICCDVVSVREITTYFKLPNFFQTYFKNIIVTMLQKPNLADVKLTSAIAKERLAKVWDVIEQSNWMANQIRIVAKIQEETGENKGNISAFLNGKRPMSNNFFQTFMDKYGAATGKVPGTGSGSDEIISIQQKGINKDVNSIESLILNNKLLADAFLRQASAHEREAFAREKEAEARIIQAQANKSSADLNMQMYLRLNSGSAQVNQSEHPFALKPLMDRMASKGVQENLWNSIDLGRIVLGRLMAAGAPEKQQVVGTGDGADKKDK